MRGRLCKRDGKRQRRVREGREEMRARCLGGHGDDGRVAWRQAERKETGERGGGGREWKRLGERESTWNRCISARSSMAYWLTSGTISCSTYSRINQALVTAPVTYLCRWRRLVTCTRMQRRAHAREGEQGVGIKGRRGQKLRKGTVFPMQEDTRKTHPFG